MKKIMAQNRIQSGEVEGERGNETSMRIVGDPWFKWWVT
jgi:hypothetical protein